MFSWGYGSLIYIFLTYLFRYSIPLRIYLSSSHSEGQFIPAK